MIYRYTSFRWATRTTSILKTASSMEYTIRYSPTRIRQASVPMSFLQPLGRAFNSREEIALITRSLEGFGRARISFWADGRIKTEYLAMSFQFFRKLMKRHSFSPFFRPSFHRFYILNVFEILDEILRQKFIQKIRGRHIVIGSFQPQSFVNTFINVKSSFSSSTHKPDLLDSLYPYYRITAILQFKQLTT